MMDFAGIKGQDTFLSAEVKNLLQIAAQQDKKSTECHDFWMLDGLRINWNVVEKSIADIKEPYQSKIWFRNAVEELAPLFSHCDRAIKDMSHEDCCQHLKPFLTWTHQEEIVLSCIRLLNTEADEVDHLLALLIITSLAERALGNVLLTRRKQVPFLLRDLLVAPELEELLGKSKIELCVILFGSVLGLNLRNIAWHGFLNPTEANSSFASTMIIILAECGQEIECNSNLKGKIPERFQIDFKEVKDLCHVFRGIQQSRSVMEEIVSKSSLIPDVMIPAWMKIIGLLEEERYGSCLVLLFPMLECSLRCLFAHVNNDSMRVLTAENSIFYTTFDEILQISYKKDYSDNENSTKDTILEQTATIPPSACKYVYSGDNAMKTESEVDNQNFICVNMVPSVIGRKLNEALHDILNFVQGPRVRDRISHGEVMLPEISQDIVYHIVSLSILLISIGNWRKESEITKELSVLCKYKDDILAKFDPKHSGAHFPETEGVLLPFRVTSFSEAAEISLKTMENCILEYKCMYHPSAILLKNLSLCLAELKYWNDWDRVCSAELDYPEWESSNLMELPYYLSWAFHKHKVISLSEINYLIALIDFKCNVLYRSKFEIELVSVLSRIISNILSSLQNIKNNLALKYIQYKSKNLRSRQRETYRRQLIAVPTIVLNCYFSCQAVHMIFISHNTLSLSRPHNNLVMVLKKILKFQENILSQTNVNMNRWDEASKNAVDNIKLITCEFGEDSLSC